MSELKDYDIMDIEAMDDERLEKSESGIIQATRVYIKSEADKVIARNKYKRCLTMARWCMVRYNEWSAYYPTTITRKMKFLDKWEKRWRELAEKFKETK